MASLCHHSLSRPWPLSPCTIVHIWCKRSFVTCPWHGTIYIALNIFWLLEIIGHYFRCARIWLRCAYPGITPHLSVCLFVGVDYCSAYIYIAVVMVLWWLIRPNGNLYNRIRHEYYCNNCVCRYMNMYG